MHWHINTDASHREIESAKARCRAVDAYEALAVIRHSRYGAHAGYRPKGENAAANRFRLAVLAFEAVATPEQTAIYHRDLDGVDEEYPCYAADEFDA